MPIKSSITETYVRKPLTNYEMRYIDENPQLSSRKLAQILRGRKTLKSTINDYRNRTQGTLSTGAPKFNGGPRVLVIDIETAPVLGYVWGLWNNDVGLNQIHTDWYILSYSAKWLGDDEVYYRDQRNKPDVEDDHELLVDIWHMLDKADIIMAHNGRRFDNKKIRARMVMKGMKPPSSYRQIDTLEIAKRNFAFTSNKLEYLTDKLCNKHKKLTTRKYAGFTLWTECMGNNIEAWDEMRDYNIVDVLSLDELFFILAPWSNNLPNLGTYHQDGITRCYCGSAEYEHAGYHHTNLSVFNKYQCVKCGSESRDRTNIISKDVRRLLTTNVVT